jgi:hypothetical protein
MWLVGVLLLIPLEPLMVLSHKGTPFIEAREEGSMIPPSSRVCEKT